MELDPDDPNLDGDFQALIEVRQKRTKGNICLVTGTKPEKETIIEVAGSDSSSRPVIPSEITLSDQTSEIFQTYTLLTEAARSDDVSALEIQIENIKKRKLSLSNYELRAPENQATVLHFALEHKSMRVAEYLIKYGEEKLLVEEYDVYVRGTPSKKTALHLLCENGNLDLVILLLNRLKPGKSKEGFLRKYVLTEIKGQRPRHLSSIHLAAIEGCTVLVEYLVGIGIDVNFVNNKGDTPVLWAARWNHLETARSLIRLGANLQQQNDKGSTPLYWAVRYGFQEMVELLIKEGKADVDQKRNLGLVSPIVLASALGFPSITEVLLKNRADVNTKVNSNFTPLHYAAMEGNTETADVLIQYGADLRSVNDAGDSPLLVAVKAKQSGMVELLAKKGADLEHRNKEGKTVWDYALNSLSTAFLTELVTIYKRVKGLADSELTFGEGKSPLHKAALSDDCEKLECLIGLGAKLDVTDEGRNTFFHLAARENSISVLEKFNQRIDVNSKNSEDDTALHLATRSGHTEAVKMLLKSSKLDIANNDGETALHTACKSRFASREVVRVILDTIAKAHNWSLVTSVDKNGNTALHVASKSYRSEIFQELRQISPRLKNKQGDCAQHMVVKTGERDILEEFLKVFRQEMHIDEPNEDGDTVLHIAMRLHSPDMLELLIDAGADLKARNKYGNTPMHELVLAALMDKENMSDYLITLDAIRDNVIYWWCKRHDQYAPDEDSELFFRLKRRSYVLLTSEERNDDGYTVISLAAKHGLKVMFEKILQTPGVYMFMDAKGTVTFDVTKLTRDTVEIPVTPHSDRDEDVKTVIKNPIQTPNSEKTHKTLNKISEQSCLGLIVRSPNIREANDMLSVIPLKQIVSDYWVAYKWLYGVLMVLHITYMALLSNFGVQLVRLSLKSPGYKASSFPNGLLLIWPVLLFAHVIYTVLSGLGRRIRGSQETESAFDGIGNSRRGISYIFHACFSFLSYHLSSITQMLFATLVIVWYVLYLLQAPEMAHVMAAALIFGWLFTIVYTPGFEAVHSYSIMIKSIFIKDISRFMILYVFVLLAFSFALQSLMYIAPDDVQGEFPTSFDIIFAVFNMMIGMYDPFSESITGGIDKYGRAAVWIKLTYLFYIIFTTIILLNLLIAMMTDSYADVKANEGSTWRVSSVGMAYNIDTALPILPKLLRYFGVRKYTPKFNAETGRWTMTMPRSEVDMDQKVAFDKTTKSLLQLQRDINRLHSSYIAVDEKLDALLTAVSNVHSDHRAEEQQTRPSRLRNRRRSAALGRFRNVVHTHISTIKEIKELKPQ